MKISEQDKRKILAAAELVDGGDMAVLKKIIEFQDFLDEWQQKMSDMKDEVMAMQPAEVKKEIDTLSSDFSLMSDQMKTMCSEMDDMLSKSDNMQNMHISEMKKMSDSMKSLMMKIDEVKNLIPEMPPQTDFTDIYNRLVEIEGKIPKIPDEITAIQVRDKLETLTKEERLDVRAVNNAPKMTVSVSPPSNPEIGDIWCQSS